MKKQFTRSDKFLMQLLKLWPFHRGRTLLTKLICKFVRFPVASDFSFKYGTFENVCVREWPWGYRELCLWGEMELSETNAWKRIVKKGDVVIDGGANQGYYSLLGSRLVGKNGSVHSFEPLPDTLRALKRNIAVSNVDNVIVNEVALMDKKSEITLKVFDNDLIGGQTTMGNRDEMVCVREIGCPTTSIDDYLEVQHASACSLVKLDIEGGELFALRGASRTIDRFKPVIAFEWNVETSTPCGFHPREITEMLEGKGYVFFLASMYRFMPFAVSESSGWTPMVWCFPKEKITWQN